MSLVNILVYIRTPDEDQKGEIEGFSRVPSIGESIQIPPGRFRVLDVTHVATSVGGGSANNEIATILVQPH